VCSSRLWQTSGTRPAVDAELNLQTTIDEQTVTLRLSGTLIISRG
jgi:hypothetical protein